MRIRRSNSAAMDPWSVVPLLSGELVLFGFALWHPKSKGLSWMNTSDVMELDLASRQATTRSGRHYSLGRRFSILDVNVEGPEARIVFDCLIGDNFEGAEKLRELDRQWVIACKIGRHLKKRAPARKGLDVKAFLDRYSDDYISYRARIDRVG